MNPPFNDEIYTKLKSYCSPLLSVYGGEIINVWDKIEDNQLWDLHKNGDGMMWCTEAKTAAADTPVISNFIQAYLKVMYYWYHLNGKMDK